ncbi:DUF732 domain-containing protein [Mycobacterium sp.]|uniref:DUF732 domain-containing protein n=1 Tax=Mycobacterium sp. TaxID=1785 RepID=UPI00128414F4|nr:DUF732 domain-containing protein [Mycobacterium sp.]KAA8968190.1 MAG: DUF732 domain-containing protein [Mycobacterium sp.]
MRRALAAFWVLAAVLPAAPAHADECHPDPAERAYLAEVAEGDVPVKPPNGALQVGHRACRDLRAGMSPEEVIATDFGVFGGAWGQTIIDAAQHHLCPDTLPPGG